MRNPSIRPLHTQGGDKRHCVAFLHNWCDFWQKRSALESLNLTEDLLLSYTWTGIHVGQNFDCVRYSKIAGLSTSLMWHGGLNLVQSCKMCCAVCTLPCSHKSEPYRPINFMFAANWPTSVLRRLSWAQAFLGRLQPGGCGPNAGMKDWRAAGIGVVGSPLIDNNSTKERRGFLERRRLGDRFRSTAPCSSMKHCALSHMG